MRTIDEENDLRNFMERSNQISSHMKLKSSIYTVLCVIILCISVCFTRYTVYYILDSLKMSKITKTIYFMLLLILLAIVAYFTISFVVVKAIYHYRVNRDLKERLKLYRLDKKLEKSNKNNKKFL